MNQCDTPVMPLLFLWSAYIYSCIKSIAGVVCPFALRLCSVILQEVGAPSRCILRRCGDICGYVIPVSRVGDNRCILHCYREGRVVKQTLAIEQDKNEYHWIGAPEYRAIVINTRILSLREQERGVRRTLMES